MGSIPTLAKYHIVSSTMDQDLQSLIYTVQDAISNGIAIRLKDDFGGPVKVDVNLVANNAPNIFLNVSGVIDVQNRETAIQSYRHLLDSLLEARKLPNHSKKLLRNDMSLDDTIDQTIILIQEEISKQLLNNQNKPEKGLN